MLQVEILSATGKIFVDESISDSGGFLNPAITFCFCLYRAYPGAGYLFISRSVSGRIRWRQRDIRNLCQRYQRLLRP